MKNKIKMENVIIILALLFLVVITLITKFYGNTDIYDYADVSKFFAGKYSADIRASHSYLYGLIHAPFLFLFNSYFIFKITSLISLFLIIYSVYFISNKNKKSLWLILISPIVWYMAPWISPIQLSSLCFLWGYYFLKNYEKLKKTKDLLISGVLFGTSWAIWDAVLFFIPLLLASFFYDRKLSETFYFTISILIGALPKFILDQIIFGFPFYTTIRHIAASLALTFNEGFYNQPSLFGFSALILTLLFIPIYTYKIFNKKEFSKNKKDSLFIILSLLLLVINSQIRFTLLIVPIIILDISKKISKKQFFIQIVVFSILTLLVINPYLIQINYEIKSDKIEYTEGYEIGAILQNLGNLHFKEEFTKDQIKRDINQIANEYPNEVFIVGNRPDSYATVADKYFGNKIGELVSIQDYELTINGESTISKKEFCTKVIINERRDYCFSIWIRKAFNDKTDYDSINYAIGEEENLNLENFKLIKEYETLYLFEKI